MSTTTKILSILLLFSCLLDFNTNIVFKNYLITSFLLFFKFFNIQSLYDLICLYLLFLIKIKVLATFDKHTCTIVNTQKWSFNPKISLTLQSHPPLTHNHWSAQSVSIVLPFPEYHMQYIAFQVWFLSLSMKQLRFIHVVTCIVVTVFCSVSHV